MVPLPSAEVSTSWWVSLINMMNFISIGREIVEEKTKLEGY